jgi:hypothetical protein
MNIGKSSKFSSQDQLDYGRLPVRSPIVKPLTGGLVVGSVTTSESPLLYVLIFGLLIQSQVWIQYTGKGVIIF